jgi:hypothetical protein
MPLYTAITQDGSGADGTKAKIEQIPSRALNGGDPLKHFSYLSHWT